MANVKGKYVFDKAQFAVANFEYKGFTFTSNGQTFYGIRVRPYSEGATVCWLEYINEDGTYTTAAFQDGGWDTNWDYGDGYKTVDFGSGADIPDELETWLDASATHKVMILKAGTYRFNARPTETYPLSQTFDYILIMTMDGETIEESYIGLETELYQDAYFSVNFQLNSTSAEKLYYNPIPEGYESIYVDGWLGGVQPSVRINDTEVADDFGSWFIGATDYNEVNAKPLATIEYNGQTIAQLNAGETATLSCEGKKMASDVVVKVNKVESKIPEGYIKPEGSLPITENGTYPVTDKEEVVVDVPIPEGYVKPSGTLELTVNNVETAFPIDCSQYAKVTVNTAEPLKITDPTVLDNITDSPYGVGGNVFLYEGATTDTYESGTLYYLEDTEK